MELHRAATAVVMDVVPCRLNVIRVSRKIDRVLLLACRHHADVRGLVAQKLDGIDFMRSKAAILAIRSRILEIVSYNSPIAGVGRIHPNLTRTEEQSGYGDIVSRDINVGHTQAIGYAGSAQRNLRPGISNKSDWITGRSAAL